MAYLGGPHRGQSQTISTIAGNGVGGYTGNGGFATSASLDAPDDFVYDSQGNLYIADANNDVVRKVNTSGIISTYVGTGTFGYSGDGGPAINATLNYPSGLAVDSQNNLYIADYSNEVVRKVNFLTGIISTVVGNGTAGYSGDGGPAQSAELNSPVRLTFDAQGNLYITDSNNYGPPGNGVVRRVDKNTNIITTFAGNGTIGYSGDGGPATSASMTSPKALVFDPAGNLYITDPGVSVVRKVAVGTGIITTIAGNGIAGFSGDGGPATLASLSDDAPDGVAVDCNGNVFLTDDLNNRVREVFASTGIIDTVIGTGTPGYGTSGSALSAEISHPETLLFRQGNMYLDQYGNNVISEISPMGIACTPTNTPTLTPTFTVTYTPTPSATQTMTNSPTYTPTCTPTSTPTNSISMGKQVSKTSAQSGDSLIYSIGVTVTNGAFNGVIVTDTLPANVRFISMVSNSAGHASFDLSTSLLQWTLPSPLGIGTYYLTYETQVNPYVPANTPLVNGARLTYSGLILPQSASTTVTTTGNYTVQVGIYNEAGELILSLWTQKYSQPIYNLTLSSEVITKLNGPGSFINLYVSGAGYFVLGWNQ